MKVNLKEISGNWDAGYALDKHLVRSVFLGHNEYGHPQFDNIRTECGQAVYQLKYKQDFSQVGALASAVLNEVVQKFGDVEFIIAAPSSKLRARQPVSEVASQLAKLSGVPYFHDFIVKRAVNGDIQPLKNLKDKDEKVAALKGQLSKQSSLVGNGSWNGLIVDDLYHTGATMEAVCELLRLDEKVNKIYVAALTWR